MPLIVAILVMLAAFFVMSKVVDEYFIKSLDNISRWLKLTPSVAGATLMAVGTSAPELSTAMFALFLPDANPATGVGTIVGSAIFQVLVVIGFAALVKTSYLNWRPVIRDGVFYSLTILLLIVFTRDGKFVLLESSILLGTYVLYLVILFVWTRLVDEGDEPNPIEVKKTGQFKRPTTEKPLLERINDTITYPLAVIIDLLPDPEEDERWTIPVFLLSLAIIGFLSYWLVLAAESVRVGHRHPACGCRADHSGGRQFHPRDDRVGGGVAAGSRRYGDQQRDW